MIALLLGCAGPVPAPASDAGELVELAAPELLRRMSLDLRGVVPGVAELDAVEADPDALAEYREAFLADPRLEDRLRFVYGEAWHTTVDDYDIQPGELGVADDEEYTFERAVGEEPIRLLAYVAANELPWSEVLAADYTLAHHAVAGKWPVDYPEGATGWQRARYTDGRPAVGVLATNGLWWRYATTEFNANRRRAAAVARLLLCEDYLERPVSFASTTTLLDDEGTAEALRTNPYCLGCHSSLDPLASALFGFWWFEDHHLVEMAYYHADREPMGELYLGVAPALYGQPVDGLQGLASALAEDPRFARCAAESMAEAMWRRPVENADFDEVERVRLAFVDGGLRVPALLRALTDGETYRAGAVAEDADTAAVAREVTRRMLSVDQLASATEDLTGFAWGRAGFDQLDNDDLGYRIMAGGVNGTNVTRPQQDAGLTWSLVVQRLAEAGASTVVAHDLVEGGSPRRLLSRVGLDSRPGDADFDAELAELHWRLYAVRPDADRLAAAAGLWSDLAAEGDAAEAWRGLLAAMLRDPGFVSD